jgi:hypothetical protein
VDFWCPTQRHGAGNLALKAPKEAGREMCRRACVNVCLWHKTDMLIRRMSAVGGKADMARTARYGK